MSNPERKAWLDGYYEAACAAMPNALMKLKPWWVPRSWWFALIVDASEAALAQERLL